MLRRRRKPPVLARIPRRQGERRRPGSLDRAELETLNALLAAVDPSRTVLVTGGEAKSTVALGLAAAAVASGRRVALVECDLSHPRLAERMGIAAAPGLVEYLRHEAEASELLQPIVPVGPAAGRAEAPLVCVAAGSSTSLAAPLLASPDFSHAIVKLRGAYRTIVLEGPSIHDEHSLLLAAGSAEVTLACCEPREIPKSVREIVDGLVTSVDGSQRS